jgi:hypothetical protein
VRQKGLVYDMLLIHNEFRSDLRERGDSRSYLDSETPLDELTESGTLNKTRQVNLPQLIYEL